MPQDIGDSPDVDVTGLTSLNLVEREPNEKSYFAATFTDVPDLIAAID